MTTAADIEAGWEAGDVDGVLTLASSVDLATSPAEFTAIADQLVRLSSLGPREPSERVLEHAVAMRRELWPPAHPRHPMADWPLAEAMIGWGEPRAARQLVESALSRVGTPNPELRRDLHSLMADRLERSGQLVEAEQWLRDALDLGLPDPEVLGPLDRLARLRRAAADHEEATALSLRIARASPSFDDSPTAEDATNLAAVARDALAAGDATAALAWITQARSILERDRGQRVHQRVQTALDHAEILIALGRPANETLDDAGRRLGERGGSLRARYDELRSRTSD